MSSDLKIKEFLEMGKKICDGSDAVDKNLFEMANLKEYRHSAILGYLLNRREQGQKIHLKSFLCRVFSKAIPIKGDLNVECEKSIEVNGSKRPIDILVTAKDFALIIENKCRGASDQPSQICDYWEGVKNKGFAEDKIYVLYLPPMNAFASPSESSLGGLGERFGKGGDLEDHLLVWSFRDLVLPWLKEDVLPKISYGTGKLVNSLRCYIDLMGVQFYAHASNADDYREKTCESFSRLAGVSDAGAMWTAATAYIDSINSYLEGKNPPEMTEGDADCLVNLRSKLWDVRSVLRERDPLLDPANLSYEVYWLLRKNPTPFASQYIQGQLDSGLFFKSGRKQSAWDSVEVGGHWIECWFHADEFAKFCRDEGCGTILTFGIGNVGEEDFSQLQNGYWSTEYLQDNRWRTFFVRNESFDCAKKANGGEMLWLVTKTVAAEAKEFYDAVASEIG